MSTPSVGRRSYSVGVTTGNLSGGGTLYIGPGELDCQLGKVNSRVSHIQHVRQESKLVKVCKSRALPFWCNVHIYVSDGRTTVRASRWSFGLKSLIDTLEAAGFEVDLQRPWIAPLP